MSIKAEKLLQKLKNKKVIRADRKDVTRLFYNNPKLQKFYGFLKGIDSSIRESGKESNILRSTLRKTILDDKNYLKDTVALAIGKNVIVPYTFPTMSKAQRRATLAHELFHTNTPILGRSEILAHLYGGLRGHNLAEETRILLRNRPLRTAAELTTAATASAAASSIIKHYKNKGTTDVQV